MIKKIGALIVILIMFISVNAQTRQVYQRFSSNPIGPLNVLGIAMSESVDSANLLINVTIKQSMKIPIDYPVYVDPTYKQLLAQGPVGISFFSQNVGGATYSSVLRSELGLGDNPSSLIIIDRKKRVRVFTNAYTFEWELLEKVIEELLLNLDNKEAISIGMKETEKDEFDAMVQTDLAKQQEEEKNKKSIVIDFGASRKKWFKYLGKEIPNLKLRNRDGSEEVNLYDLLNGKVSAVIIFIAALNPQVANIMPGMGVNLILMDGLYRDFTLGEAKKGKKVVPNAFPE